MARPNRFNNRNPVAELQRRQAQVATGVFNSQGEGQRPARDWNATTLPGTARAIGIDFTGRADNGFRWYTDTAVARPVGFWDIPIINPGNIVRNAPRWPDMQIRNREPQIFQQPVPPGFDPGRVWAQPINPEVTDWTRPPGDERPPRRTRDHYRNIQRIKRKTESLKPGYTAAMVLGVNYEGKTFHYKVNLETGIGTWYVSTYVETYPVAEIDLSQVRLIRLMLPVATDAVYNRTRLLWRQLGLDAVRYKDKTFVALNGTARTLKPGEQWSLLGMESKQYVKPPGLLTEQLKLIDEQPSPTGLSPGTSHTKPVGWQRTDGTPILWGIFRFGDAGNGRAINLNHPERPTN